MLEIMNVTKNVINEKKTTTKFIVYEWHIDWYKKSVYIHKTCFWFFKNNLILTTSRIITLTNKMTMNKKLIYIISSLFHLLFGCPTTNFWSFSSSISHCVSVNFWSGGHWEHRNKIRSLSLSKCLVEFEPKYLVECEPKYLVDLEPGTFQSDPNV